MLVKGVIRAQSAKVASLEANLAVQRAHVAQDLRWVLTPDQIEKLKKMQVDVDAHIDQGLARVAKRIAEEYIVAWASCPCGEPNGRDARSTMAHTPMNRLMNASFKRPSRAIVMDAQQQVRVVRHQIQPEVERILQDSATRVRGILRPDQQARFDQLAADARARWKP